jgi:hypothetical protein
MLLLLVDAVVSVAVAYCRYQHSHKFRMLPCFLVSFRKIKSDPLRARSNNNFVDDASHWRFGHPQFRKDKPELLVEIKRTVSTPEKEEKCDSDNLKTEIEGLKEIITSLTETLGVLRRNVHTLTELDNNVRENERHSCHVAGADGVDTDAAAGEGSDEYGTHGGHVYKKRRVDGGEGWYTEERKAEGKPSVMPPAMMYSEKRNFGVSHYDDEHHQQHHHGHGQGHDDHAVVHHEIFDQEPDCPAGYDEAQLVCDDVDEKVTLLDCCLDEDMILGFCLTVNPCTRTSMLSLVCRNARVWSQTCSIDFARPSLAYHQACKRSLLSIL